MRREQLDVKLTLPPMKVRKVLSLLSQKTGPPGIFNLTDDKSQAKMGQKSPEEQTKALYEDMKKNYMEKGKKPLILDAFGAPIWDIKK